MAELQRRFLVRAPWSAVGLAVLVACGAEPGGTGEGPCASFVAAEPVSVESQVSVVAEGQGWIYPRSKLAPVLTADASGVYWYDMDGNVFGRRRGAEEAQQLLVSPEAEDEYEPQWQVLSMVSGAEQLFIGDGYLPPTDFLTVHQFRPPSRLLSLSKQGGEPTVLVSSDEETLWPIAIDGDRLIVMGAGEEVRYYELSLTDPALEPLPLSVPPNLDPEVHDGALYWSEDDELLRWAFDDAEPETVAELSPGSHSVGPGYYLTHRVFDQWDIDASTLRVKAAGSTCSKRLPKESPQVSSHTALDPRQVYFYNHDRNESLSGSTPAGSLMRADIETGELTRLNLSGARVQSNFHILGHDTEHVYVFNGNDLLAVTKP